MRLPRLAFALVPYAAVLAGMYALESAWAAMLLYHAGIGLAWFALGRRPPPRSLVEGLLARWAVPLLVGALAVAPAIFLAWPAAALTPDLRAALARYGLSGASLAAFAVYSAIVNPAIEELFWRGALADPSPGPAPADALFAGYHALVLALVIRWPFALGAALGLAAAAYLFRRAAARSGGLAAPYLAHLAADLAVMGAVWALL